MIKKLFSGFFLAFVLSGPAEAITVTPELKRFDYAKSETVLEAPPAKSYRESAVRIDLENYYKSFRNKKKVQIYYGGGYGFDGAYRNPSNFNSMLQALAAQEGVQTSNWVYDRAARRISFTVKQIEYVIQLGAERNEFQEAFAHYEVVMYHGHSRYGRGPTFGTFWNYFRMGSIFPEVEVNADNSYFLKEPLVRTQEYPPKSVEFNGQSYLYQYRGSQTDHYILPDSFTKLIAGYDSDLRVTPFLKGPQILWFYSCANANYFKVPLRGLFPDPQDKIVFGTVADSYFSEQPAAVFIMSLVTEVRDTKKILKSLNDIKDCSDCFTTY